MPFFSRRSRVFFGFVCLAVALFTGCENTIDPISERAPYSVYGYLSLSNSPHFIRVKPLGDPILPNTGLSIDATVTLTNLEDGTSRTLTDSIITFDGTPTHNFWTNGPVQPRTEYRLTVERSDGATTQATAVTPTDTDASLDTLGSANPPHCRTPLQVHFRTAEFPYRARIGFNNAGQTQWLDQDIQSLRGGGQGLRFNMESVLFGDVFDEKIDDPETCRYYEPLCLKLDDGQIKVAYTYLGPDWFGNRPSEGDSFDLIESSQVSNGRGFFGGVYQDTLEVEIDTSIIDLGPEACGPP